MEGKVAPGAGSLGEGGGIRSHWNCSVFATQSVAHESAASAASGSLLEMENLRPYPDLLN